MRSFLLASLCVFASAAPHGGTQDDTPSKNFAVRCGKIYTGNGKPLSNAWLIVRDGRIVSVSKAPQAPAGLRVIDASDKVVMPGIVAADTDLVAAGTDAYNVTPDFMALDGFDFMRRYRGALSGGVTSVYLAPERNKLIAGQGAVVKLHGDDLVERVLSESNCLRLTLGRESTNARAIFEPVINPTSDDPLKPARKQYPSARISQLATLETLFRDAVARKSDNLVGFGSAENNYDEASLRAAAAGNLQLRIAAREAADIRRAVLLAKRLGNSNVVLENPYAISTVASYAAKNKASAVFRMPIQISAQNRGGEDLNRLPKAHNRPENPALAARAGMRIALTPNRSADLADFLMVAAISIRYGLDADTALRAITSDAAAILGVADRVGTLDTGKDADFLILSGDPFAIGTMVEKTFVSGELAYQREDSSGLLAIKAKTIITAEGRTLQNGVILVANGKIKSVGEDLAIPYGARIVEVPNGVMVPGFIDANSSLGLSGRGAGIPSGKADQRIAEVVDPRDPNLRSALQAGITTAFVSGTDSGTVAGRVTAIKTGAKDRESMVLRDIAGLRFVHNSIKPNAIKALSSSIDKGKKYVESWKKYDKALAEWKAGKKKAKPVEAKKAAPKEAAKNDPVTGTWEINVKDPFPITVTATLTLAGTKVTGEMTMSFNNRPGPSAEVAGTFIGKDLTLTGSAMGGTITLKSTVENDSMTGTFAGGPGGRMKGEITGTRTSKSNAKPKKKKSKSGGKDDGSPKKPTLNHALEPIRALLAGKIPAIIRTNRAPAIKAVIEYFEKAKLPYILHEILDAIDTPNVLKGKTPNIMLGPILVRRDGKKLINAAATVADLDAPLALVTGDTAGSSYLPLHAAHAIRYGMDPEAALRALTIGPAKMFKLDKRVGSLRRGKDADFVIFSGSPFEMTSRVIMVVCNGEIVVDHREKEGSK